MKKSLLMYCLLFLMVWIAKAQDCTPLQSTDLPIEENFSKNTLPNCWDSISNQSGSTAKMFLAYYHSSPSSIFINAALNTNYDTSFVMLASMPISDLVNPKSLRTRFWARTGNAATTFLVVGILPDTANPKSFIAVDTIRNFATASAWYPFTVSFKNFTGTIENNKPYRIAYRILSTATVAASMYVDDVVIEKIPTCPDVSGLKMVSAEATSLMLSLVPDFDRPEMQFQTQYKKEGEADWNYSLLNNIPDSIGSLLPGENYLIRARSYCNNGTDIGIWTIDTLHAKTECTAITTKNANGVYSYENFDAITVPVTTPYNLLPNCWNSYLKYQPTGITMPYVSVNKGNQMTGANMLYLKYAGADSLKRSPIIAILPPMMKDTDFQNIRLSLYARSFLNSDSTALAVGIMTNPLDTTTFFPIDTFANPYNTTTAYRYFETNLSKYPNASALSGKYYIALKLIPKTFSNINGVCVDELKVDLLPACPDIFNIKAISSTPTSIKVNFTSEADSFRVAYRMQGTADWTYLSELVKSKEYVVKGLESDTGYEITVKSVCNGTQEGWFSMISAVDTTKCAGKTLENLPIFEDFKSSSIIPNCWQFALVTNGSNATASIATNIGNHSRCVYLNSGTGASFNTRIEALVLPSFNPSVDFKKIAVTFQIRRGQNPVGRQFGITTDPDALSDFVVLQQDSVSPANTWYNDTLSLAGFEMPSSISGKSPEVVYFAFKNTSTAATQQLYFDSIQVLQAPICPAPTNLIMDSCSQTGARFTWTEAVGEAPVKSYQLVYKTSPAGNNVVVNNITGTNAIVTGLTAKTTYEAKLYSVCAFSTSEPSNLVKFTTLFCDTVKTITSSDITSISAIITWSTAGGSQWDVRYAKTADFATNAKDTLIKDFTTFKLTGLSPLTEYSVSVRSRCADNNIGVWSQVAKFTTIECSTVTGITPVPAATTASVTWNAAGKTQWQVRYAVKTAYATTPILLPMVYGSSSNNITGLTPGTTYTVGIRAICGEGDTSAWSAGVDFTTTKCAVVTGITPVPAATTASVTWNAAGKTQWQVRTMQGATQISLQNIYENAYSDITELAPATNYTVAIRAICGAGDTSDWSAAVGFATTKCATVTGVDVANITTKTANITWNADGKAQWQVRYATEEEYDINPVILPMIYGNSQAALTGLTGKTAYEVSVRAICSIGDTSNWAEIVTFSTKSCEKIVEIVVGKQTSNSTSISWNAPETQSMWKISYAKKADFEAERNIQNIIVENTEYTFTKLDSKTEYTFVIYAICGEGDTSDASTSRSFTTPICEPVSNIVVSDITKTSATVAWEAEIAQTQWQVSYVKTSDATTRVTQFTDERRIGLTDLHANTEYMVIIRGICGVGDTSSNATKSFSTESCAAVDGVQLGTVTSSTVDLQWKKDSIEYEIRYGIKGTDVAKMTNIIHVAKSEAKVSYIQTIEGLSPETSYDIYIRSICDTTDKGPWSNVLSFTTTKCSSVTGLRLDTIRSGNRVEISWNKQAGQTHWQVNLIKQGQNPDENGVIRITDTNWYQFTNIIDSTNINYIAYVRTSCGGDVYSSWQQVTIPKADLGVSTAAMENINVVVSPNPARDYANISITGAIGLVEMNVINVNGEVVLTEKFYCEKDYAKNINLNNLAKGTYVIRLGNANWTKTQKLIVQ